MKQESCNVLRLATLDETRVDEEGDTLRSHVRARSTFAKRVRRTLFGLKLNFLIPSSKVVFLCLAFSKRLGSSLGTTSGVAAPDKLLSIPGRPSPDRPDPPFATVVKSVSLPRPIAPFPSSLILGGPGVPGVVVGSAAPPPAPFAAHETRLLSTATRHSRLCRLR